MAFQLPAEQIRRRQELTRKLMDETISFEEAAELKAILENEREQATAANDFLAILAIIGLLSLLATFLSDDTKKSKKTITNVDFTATLGKVLSRPTMFSIPEFIIKSALGEELANAAILSSSRVIPKHLIKIGYKFRFPYLESILLHTLGKSIS